MVKVKRKDVEGVAVLKQSALELSRIFAEIDKKNKEPQT